jgi:hypothetical protein
VIPPRPPGEQEVVIEAQGLTQRFGTFTAVDPWSGIKLGILLTGFLLLHKLNFSR